MRDLTKYNNSFKCQPFQSISFSILFHQLLIDTGSKSYDSRGAPRRDRGRRSGKLNQFPLALERARRSPLRGWGLCFDTSAATIERELHMVAARVPIKVGPIRGPAISEVLFATSVGQQPRFFIVQSQGPPSGFAAEHGATAEPSITNTVPRGALGSPSRPKIPPSPNLLQNLKKKYHLDRVVPSANSSAARRLTIQLSKNRTVRQANELGEPFVRQARPRIRKVGGVAVSEVDVSGQHLGRLPVTAVATWLFLTTIAMVGWLGGLAWCAIRLVIWLTS